MIGIRQRRNSKPCRFRSRDGIVVWRLQLLAANCFVRIPSLPRLSQPAPHLMRGNLAELCTDTGAKCSEIPAAERRPLNYPLTAPASASERGPAPSLASYRRPCLSPVSGQPGPIRAAWALPKRVPARGRGRETEFFKSLRRSAGMTDISWTERPPVNTPWFRGTCH